MNISPGEQQELADTLYEAYLANNLDYYGEEAVLYYAVWWQRIYSGGFPSKEMIAYSLDIPAGKSDIIYKAARRAMHKWGFRVIHDTRYHYFRSLLLQGGLPMNHVVNSQGNFNNYSEFLKSLIRDMTNYSMEFTPDTVSKLNCVSYLPRSFCNSSIYEISIQIGRAIIEDREDLLPYDSSKDGELKDLTSSLQRTVKQARKERNSRPLSFSWMLHIDKGELSLFYSLNNTANISSNMLPGLHPKDCFSFDLFIAQHYVATYKRSSMEENEYGHVQGIYHRMNFDERYFNWKGESYIELKLIPNDGEELHISALNCYPPDFSVPQQFQKANDCYVQQRGRHSEENIVIAKEDWISKDIGSDRLTLKSGLMVNCYSFKDSLSLKSCKTGELRIFDNTFTKYCVEFSNIYISWLEKCNYKLLSHVPVIFVYDENMQRLELKQFSVTFRRKGEKDWYTLNRNIHMPFGLIEIKVDFPDHHSVTEVFYSIGDLSFSISAETMKSADMECFCSHGNVVLETNDNISAKVEGVNKWHVERIASSSVSPVIAFSVLHNGDPALHLDLPAPFKGLLVLDRNNQEVARGAIISMDSLSLYRIVTHGIGSPNMRISYVNNLGQEEKVSITEDIHEGITPLSHFEEAIQRIYNLYANNYNEKQNYILLVVNGISIKVRRYTLDTILSNDKSAVDVFGLNEFIQDKYFSIYNDNIYAIADNSERSFDDIEPKALIKQENDLFAFPQDLELDQCIIFSDKFAENKIIPTKGFSSEDTNILDVIKNTRKVSNWTDKLNEERLDSGIHWQLAVRYFEVASENKLPFKVFDVMNQIADSPELVAKLMVTMFLCGKQDTFAADVGRFEQEYAIGIHWIRPIDWQDAVMKLFTLYSDPQVGNMLLNKFIEFLREVLNNTLDSDYIDTIVKLICEQDIGHAGRLTSNEIMELRSYSVGKTDANTDLPSMEINLEKSYMMPVAERSMTTYQLTMIKAPMRVVEYIRDIGNDLWKDKSEENMKLRRVVNFYRTYFTTVYSRILVRALLITNQQNNNELR
ncbi:MAG: hypothetical protein LKE54_13380 [Prevotella sp.]|jgi:hypothetical protein|nr:hypothetical protein [Prevotella sp.]MCH3996002.1 hypothetical protein [Prevotella sp.]